MLLRSDPAKKTEYTELVTERNLALIYQDWVSDMRSHAEGIGDASKAHFYFRLWIALHEDGHGER